MSASSSPDRPRPWQQAFLIPAAGHDEVPVARPAFLPQPEEEQQPEQEEEYQAESSDDEYPGELRLEEYIPPEEPQELASLCQKHHSVVACRVW